MGAASLLARYVNVWGARLTHGVRLQFFDEVLQG